MSDLRTLAEQMVNGNASLVVFHGIGEWVASLVPLDGPPTSARGEHPSAAIVKLGEALRAGIVGEAP